MVDHGVGGVPLGLACGSEDCLHFAEAAPLPLLFEAAGMGVLMLGEDGGEGTRM